MPEEDLNVQETSQEEISETPENKFDSAVQSDPDIQSELERRLNKVRFEERESHRHQLLDQDQARMTTLQMQARINELEQQAQTKAESESEPQEDPLLKQYKDARNRGDLDEEAQVLAQMLDARSTRKAQEVYLESQNYMSKELTQAHERASQQLYQWMDVTGLKERVLGLTGGDIKDREHPLTRGIADAYQKVTARNNGMLDENSGLAWYKEIQGMVDQFEKTKTEKETRSTAQNFMPQMGSPPVPQPPPKAGSAFRRNPQSKTLEYTGEGALDRNTIEQMDSEQAHAYQNALSTMMAE